MWTALGLYTSRKENVSKSPKRWKKKKNTRLVILPEELFLTDENHLPKYNAIKIQEDPFSIQQELSAFAAHKKYEKFNYSYDESLPPSPLKHPRSKNKLSISTFSLNEAALSPSGSPLKARGFSSPNTSMTSENLDMTPRYRSVDQLTNERMAIYNNVDEINPGIATLSSLDEEEEGIVDAHEKIASPEPKVELPSVVPKVDTWNDNYKPPTTAHVKVSPTKSKQKAPKAKPVGIRGGGGKNAASMPSWMVKNALDDSPTEEECDPNGDDHAENVAEEKEIRTVSSQSMRINSANSNNKSSRNESPRNLTRDDPQTSNKHVSNEKTKVESRSSGVYKPSSGSLETLDNPHKDDKSLWKSSDSGFQESTHVENHYKINTENRKNGINHVNEDSHLDHDSNQRLELVTHSLGGYKGEGTNGIGHYQGKNYLDFTDNGDVINHLDTSDLSSEVFTDSEMPSKSNKHYQNGDSPNSELLNSRTPCSTRHNSLDSELDDKDSDVELNRKDQQGPVKPKIKSALLDMNDVRSKLGGKDKNMNGISGSPSKKVDTKNVKAKVGSTANIHYRPGGGNARIESQKLGFSKNAKSKVNSFGNFNHIPGGGQEKIYHQHVDYGSAETRTDTHGVEVYAHLPTEFQEIARRLARQEAELQRQSSSSGSSARSRSRSRATSRASSRASSTSPSRTSSRLAHVACFSGSVNSLTSPVTHHIPFKATPRPVSRSSSLRSIPSTPALSHTHPATYSTLHSSRPPSRPGSRSSSPTHIGDRSRNSSPSSRLPRSRGSSPERQSRTRLRDSSPSVRKAVSKSPGASKRSRTMTPNGRKPVQAKPQGMRSTTPNNRVHRPIKPGDARKISNGYQRGNPIMSF